MPAAVVTVLDPGFQTTIQDGGRPGYLAKGVPPAGAQDVWSLRLASLLVGNALPPPPLTPGEPGDAGIEMTFLGATLEFSHETVVAMTGAEVAVTVNGEAVPCWEAVVVPAGGVLRCGPIAPGVRAYLAVAGGFDVPLYLGSRATFIRGAQGGLNGRALRKGDVIPLGEAGESHGLAGRRIREDVRPALGPPSTIRVVPGPQDHLFTDEGLATFFSADWMLNPMSDRMGFRFIGPPLAMKERPEYLIRDAGSGPADIVDDCTPVGGIQVPGGIEPIAMGVENPTAGGYAKIGVVITADFGVLGQVRPREVVHFQAVTAEEAVAIARAQAELATEAAFA
ncbi:MAG: biotin-dependent carboxyltransferase family protein [Gaiellales bacterium]